MIESKFEYTQTLINKINTSSVRKYNLFNEIAMFILLLSAIILFISGKILLGVIFSAIFIMLLVSLIFANKDIARSNRVLVGQRINVVFGKESMKMTAKLGNRVLYNATFEYNAIKKINEKSDLVYVYFDKKTVVVLPKNSFKTSSDLTTALELMSNNYLIKTGE